MSEKFTQHFSVFEVKMTLTVYGSGLGLLSVIGREPDLALVLTRAKKFLLQFLFSLTLGTYQVLVLFCQTGRFKP